MSVMNRVALRTAALHRMRYLLGALAIATSVAYVVGSGILSAVVGQAVGGSSTPLMLLKLFGIVVLVSASLVVTLSFDATMGARTQELALLRTVGANRGQVLRSVVAEGVAVGAVATAVGVGVGTAAGLGTAALVIHEAPAPAAVIGSVVAGLFMGPGVTLLAVTAPALAAARIPPVAALGSQWAQAVRRGHPVRLAVGVLGLVSGVGMAVLAVVGRSPVVVMLAGMVAFAGFVLVGPWASPWIAARLAGRRRAVPGTLAGRDMRRQPRRVAQTVLAMALGVGVTSGVLTVVSTGGELVDRQLPVQAIYVFEPGSYVSLWDDLAAATGIEPQLQDAGLISVTVPGGAEVGTVLPQVQSALQTHPDAQVITRQEARQLMFGPMLGALVATAAMALMTLVLGLVGVLNTVVLGVHERRREFAVLRAVGLERADLLRLVRREGSVLAGTGVLLGLLFGAGGAAAVLSSAGFTAVMPWGWLAALAAAGVIGAAALSVVPAYRGARTPPVGAFAAV